VHHVGVTILIYYDAGQQNNTLLYSVNLKERDYLRNPNVDRRIILKLILHASSGTVLTGLYGSVQNQRRTVANQAIGLCLSFKTDTFLCSRATVGSLRTSPFQGLQINYAQIHDKTNYECAGSKNKDTGTLFPKYEGSTQQWEMASDGEPRPATITLIKRHPMTSLESKSFCGGARIIPYSDTRV
jgi:hypothetical protein